jgi:MATE family multidrug resistance protein
MTTMTQNNNDHLGENLKHVARFALPMVMNMLIGIIPTLCSMWFLSRLGKDQLAAAGLASPSFYTVITFFVVGLTAIGIKVGHSLGKGEQHDVGLWVRNGFLLAILLCIPAVLILLNLSHLLLWMGQKPHLVALAKPFFMYGAMAIVMMLLNTVINQYFSGIGHPKIAFIMQLITLPLIIALSYVLVLGKFGFHQYALGGINLASFWIDALMFIAALCIAHWAKFSKHFAIFESLSGITWERCKDLINLGWPISVQVSGELLAITIVAYFIGLFGADALAASQITQQFILVYVMIVLGLSQAVGILVSQARGKGDLSQVHGINRAGIVIVVCLAVFFGVFFIGMPRYLVHMYLDMHHPAHSVVVDYAVKFMAIGAIYNLFDGMRNVMTGTLRGMQDSKIPMQIGIISLWFIGLPLSAFAGFIYPHGAVALRGGFMLSVIVATIWLWLRYRRNARTL